MPLHDFVLSSVDEVPDLFATVFPIGIVGVYTVIAWRSYVHQNSNCKNSNTPIANADKQFARLTPASPKLSANSNDPKSMSHVIAKEKSESAIKGVDVDIENGQSTATAVPSKS